MIANNALHRDDFNATSLVCATVASGNVFAIPIDYMASPTWIALKTC